MPDLDDSVFGALMQIKEQIGQARSDINALRETIAEDRSHNRSHIAMLVTGHADHRREISELQARPVFTDARAQALDEIIEERAEKHEDRRERGRIVVDKMLLAATAPLAMLFGAVGTVIAHKLGLA